MEKIEIYLDENYTWRFAVLDLDGKLQFTSRAFASKSMCMAHAKFFNVIG